MKPIFILILSILSILPINAEPIDDATFLAVMRIADEQGVPRSVAARLMYEESGNPGRGCATARGDEATGWVSLGLYQIHTKPSNLNYLVNRYWYGCGNHALFDILNPRHNATVALGYLAELHRVYGTWFYACCYYNAGRVKKIPAQTRAYAMRIISAPEPVWTE